MCLNPDRPTMPRMRVKLMTSQASDAIVFVSVIKSSYNCHRTAINRPYDEPDGNN